MAVFTALGPSLNGKMHDEESHTRIRGEEKKLVFNAFYDNLEGGAYTHHSVPTEPSPNLRIEYNINETQ
jgi:hypothetical protein